MTDNTRPETTEARANAAAPALTIDWELLGDHLKDLDLNEEEEAELVEALWPVVVAFVDLAFGLHPAQQVVRGCEQNEQSGKHSPVPLADMVSLKDIPKTNFDRLPLNNGHHEEGFQNE